MLFEIYFTYLFTLFFNSIVVLHRLITENAQPLLKINWYVLVILIRHELQVQFTVLRLRQITSFADITHFGCRTILSSLYSRTLPNSLVFT